MGCWPSRAAAVGSESSSQAGDTSLGSSSITIRGASQNGTSSGTAGTEAKGDADYEFRVIYDKYETFEEVAAALRASGLESSNLVMAVDYTKSNQWTGAKSFGGRCLHDMGGADGSDARTRGMGGAGGGSPGRFGSGGSRHGRSKGRRGGSGSGSGRGSGLQDEDPTAGGVGGPIRRRSISPSEPSLAPPKNPYQKVIEIIGRTLAPFDDDNMIPAFGFGDLTTGDRAVFPFLPSRPCRGFEEVLERYVRITPQLQLSGPTNFAPAIEATMEIVRETGGYHILLIIADGQVTNKDHTVRAICEASKMPLSIVMVGVGDGPWDTMEEFDDGLPERDFDNFQFVNYTKVVRDNPKNPDVAFAIAALQEVPEQFEAIKALKLI